MFTMQCFEDSVRIHFHPNLSMPSSNAKNLILNIYVTFPLKCIMDPWTNTGNLYCENVVMSGFHDVHFFVIANLMEGQYIPFSCLILLKINECKHKRSEKWA